MNKWMALGMGLAFTAALTPRLWAQLPGGAAPPAAAVPAAAVPVAPVAAPAASPATLWSFLGLDPASLAACKQKICNSPIGLLMNNAMKPVSAMSGGLLGGCCPTVPSDADVAALAAQDPGEGAAAAIKKDTAEAKARRLAARYLGTVDCHWWPEAQDGLIGFLRTDKNECVRLEAALALGRGCCCTRPVIAALIIVVKGSDEDGQPSENSERVRAAASAALAHCLGCYHEVKPVEEKKGEGVEPTRGPAPEKLPLAARPAKPRSEFARKVEAIPMEKLIEEARRVLAKTSTSVAPPGMPEEGRSHGLIEVVAKAITSSRGPRPSAEAAVPAVTDTPAAPAAPELVRTHREPPTEVKPVAHQEPQRPAPVKVEAPAAEVSPPASPVVPATAVSAPARPAAPTPVPSTPSVPAAEAGSESSYCPADTAPPVIHNGGEDKPPAPAAEASSGSSKCPAAAGPSAHTGSEDKPHLPAAEAGSGSSYCPAAVSPSVLHIGGGDKPQAPADDSKAGDGAVVNHRQMLALLKDSMYPEQRAWAADNMANFDWHVSPEIADGLIAVARKDTVSAVRVACIRCLVKMNIKTAAAVSALEALKADADSWVSKEAEQALTKLARPAKPEVATKAGSSR